MKKYICKLALILGVLGCFTVSCDDYLDVVPKGKDIMKEVGQYAALFNNVTMHNYSPNSFEFVVDDKWLTPAYISMPGTIPYNNFYFVDPSTTNRLNLFNTTAIAIYENCYDRINKICNITLDNIGDATGDPDLRKLTIAEARALRAYNYFILVNVLGKPYDAKTASSDLCVPLFDHYGLTDRPKQATVAELYQFIEDDLSAAIPDLSDSPENPLHFSKAAAYALQAKVYLMKKDFANAEASALKSYDLNHYVYDYKAMPALTSIVKINHNRENLYFGFGTSQTTFSWGAISPELSVLFGADTSNVKEVKDIRFSQFMSFTTTTVGDIKAKNEAERGDAAYAPAYDDKLNGARYYSYNLSGLRTTDVILILAECRARANDFANMKKYLDEVRKMRIVGYTTASENPTDWVDAVNIVINERRKEFLGGFNRWMDLRRLNTEPEFKRTTTRVTPANPLYSPQVTYTLPADSWLWVMPLPENEFPLYPGLQYNVPY